MHNKLCGVPLLAVLLISTALGAGPTTTTAPAVDFEKQVLPILNNYCVSCHSGAEPKGDTYLSFKNEKEARDVMKSDKGLWPAVVKMVSNKDMPPNRAPRKPTDDERNTLITWVNSNMLGLDHPSEPNPGRFLVHRLNNREYANTIRDLLYLPADWDASADFPADDRGAGFDNNSDTLTISPVLIEHYLDAAEKSVSFALNLNPKEIRKDNTLASKSKLNAPGAKFKEDFADRQAKVRLNIEVFAPRAYRRPVTKEEVDQLMRFASLSFTHDGESFDKATGLAIRAAIMNPEFLFRMERDPNPDGTGKPFQVTEFQLASRLSYFLWASMPDDELFQQAKDGKLRENLDDQVKRMLQSPKAISLTTDFAGQWLEIRSIEKTPNCAPELLSAMKGETEHFFDYIVHEDRSIMDFLDADYTFVNETLAKHYGMFVIRDDIRNVLAAKMRGEIFNSAEFNSIAAMPLTISGDEFHKVKVDTATRGGIFTQASFLTITSKPLALKDGSITRRTSPVNRGKWILENIFNQSIPPPPPNVPSLEIDGGKELTGTVRQIFEQHRADPHCAECHARMDPYGFALENYDGFGAWRTQDNKIDVDASGEVEAKKFTTPQEFRAILATRRADFRRSMVEKLLGYALGRGIEDFDQPAVDEICAAVEKDGDRFSSVILNLVKSYPFQYARGSITSVARVEAH